MAYFILRRVLQSVLTVLGVITKEHVADSVATSIEVYPASA